MGTLLTNSYLETQSAGEEFAKNLKGGSAVCLYGDLGAGKTTFVQGIALGLGIKNRIISPSFIIVREHKINDKRLEIKNLYHIDLYRIEKEKDLEGLGLDEILSDKNSIIVIEWAEKIKSKLPKDRVDIYFENLEENKRKITINKISNS